MGHTDGEMGWRGKRLDEARGTDTTSQRGRCSVPARIHETSGGKENLRQTRARRGGWMNGWTLPELRGLRSLDFVDFGIAVATPATAELAF